ncbi:glycosyltransferase [Marinobacter changyiensis]|uniref:glycosyltransferase family protein n=1 Tax=Marinobacter changyiensis TaxID=2604091 RepID=UPI0012659B97|nr:glycosyltransferase [Marinobacter changyiensis]
MLVEVGRLLPDRTVSVARAGLGWAEQKSNFPSRWQFPGPIFGRAYGEFVRRGRIVIAPVHTDVVIDGKQQPGDQDTTRTCELASAGTFFLHRRTPFVQQVYEEDTECGFWDDAAELAEKIRHFLPLERKRQTMAPSARRRTVPAYSVPARAHEVLTHIETLVKGDSSQWL